MNTAAILPQPQVLLTSATKLELKLDSTIKVASSCGAKIYAPWRNFFIAMAILALCFGKPLFDLLRLAAESDLYSYIPLIPLVSLYLVWLKKENLPRHFQPAKKIAAIFFAAGFAIVLVYLLGFRAAGLPVENILAFNIFAFLLFFTGLCFLILGTEMVRAIAFPLCLLIFIVPLPDFLQRGIETFLQIGSAAVANVFFMLSEMPVFQDGLRFQLPGFSLQVAPECSGIRSSLVLLILSLLAGQLFLRRPWTRAALALAVIPLALLRNGFRIFVIGQLCVRVGPQMIDSPIHRHGGPLFFLLSLIPFFALLILLRKLERAKPKNSNSTLQSI
jgi:exosortase C (VPDSG-CTERM-specific)